MGEGVEITIRSDELELDRIAPGLYDLIGRCYKEKPAKKDLAELQGYLDSYPELWAQVFDLAQVVRDQITSGWIPQRAAQKAIAANIEELKAGMGYDQAPMVERLLIDNVVNTWLRCQWAEMMYSRQLVGSLQVGEYWLQVLGSSQRRHLAAIETLARVRRITRATMQINIAEPGSQQVNIAGDMVKK